eukprot:CAMPEP_0174711868 /NCGR_PEP_ID=MMETSP1094-20130205/13060_1 /TAXON_ID=156173 /ORGANISM="Chrysochromulina brevifilum, Strain UTEX LB 985" /LENGTH=63 /DNA_ID=CAMNT_0015910867 /DNA_START=791 /DNA_END=979 /DNA_ORIENTATION=+
MVFRGPAPAVLRLQALGEIFRPSPSGSPFRKSLAEEVGGPAVSSSSSSVCLPPPPSPPAWPAA